MTHIQTQLLSKQISTISFEGVLRHPGTPRTTLCFRPTRTRRFTPSPEALRTAKEELAYFDALLNKRMEEANSDKCLEEARSANDEDFERLLETSIEVVCTTLLTLKLSDVSPLGRSMAQAMLSAEYGRLSKW